MMKCPSTVLIASVWLLLGSIQAAIASPAKLQKRATTKPATILTSLTPHRLTTRPQDPYTFRVSHSTIALTVGDFNRPFPDSGKDIKPAFSLFSHWFDFQIGIHSDAQYTVPSPRTGLRWDAQNTRVVIYPEEGKLTLTAILAVVMGVQAFMRSYEYMELSFVVKNVGGEKLAVGACYYLRPLGRPGVDDRAVKE